VSLSYFSVYLPAVHRFGLARLQVAGGAFHIAQHLTGFADEFEVDEHGRGRLAHVLGLAGDVELGVAQARVDLDVPAVQHLVGADGERFAGVTSRGALRSSSAC